MLTRLDFCSAFPTVHVNLVYVSLFVLHQQVRNHCSFGLDESYKLHILKFMWTFLTMSALFEMPHSKHTDTFV